MSSTAISEWPDNMPLDEQVDRLANLLLSRFGGPTRSEGAIEMAFRLLNEQVVDIEYLRGLLRRIEDELSYELGACGLGSEVRAAQNGSEGADQ